ncbi:hypothetical protein TSMEX_004383 [Taenia solium]|eukprot:TsM_000905400 transcript=TsM_000905400 gene=TsM_000905400
MRLIGQRWEDNINPIVETRFLRGVRDTLVIDIRLPHFSYSVMLKMARSTLPPNSMAGRREGKGRLQLPWLTSEGGFVEDEEKIKSGGKKEEEEREDPSTLVAASAVLPHFKDGMSFEDWMKTARSNIHLCPHWQRVLLILRALSQELFLAAIDAGVTANSDIDHCCEILSQLAIDQREQSLAREFFHRDQKAGENDGEYARNLQHLAERAFRGSHPNKVTNWVAVQFRAGVRPPTIAAKFDVVETNDLNQLAEAATRKRQELLLTPAS